MLRLRSFFAFFSLQLLLVLFLSSHAALLAPDMSTCLSLTSIPSQEANLNCCAPTSSSPPSPYLLSPTPLASLKIRRPSHVVDHTYAQKLARAYNLMRALPPEDPRSFYQQANIHCAYCNGAYAQVNSTKVFQVHGSWTFFPFHRWYLYFHERILAKLLGDDTFALSFWNYDHPDGSTMPWIFTDVPDLVDVYRDALHQPPSVVAIDFTFDTDFRTREHQLEANANAMYQIMIRRANTQRRFFGVPYRVGDDSSSGYGTVEERPHNNVHIWAGNRAILAWSDMGNFFAAARDPMFYAHHSNLDRFWEVWKSFEGNVDIDDPDYLDTQFAFYDENAELVSVTVRDSLNITKMGYSYEDVENLWINAIPVRQSIGVATLTPNDSLCTLGEPILKPCSATVQRDLELASMGQLEEDLTLTGIQWKEGYPTAFDIFINLPTANINTTTGCPEYVSTFSTVPQFSMWVNETSRSYDITESVSDLNLTGESSLIVTIVPRGLLMFASASSIDNFTIEYSEPSYASKAQVQ